MKTILITILCLPIVYFSYGQGVGIGTVPNGSAMLDVNATNKGLLAPRVALTSTLDATTITNGNVISLLVYNTATVADVMPGYYYWDGAIWKSLEGEEDHDWYEVGGMTAPNNITNNIYTQGNVGIGTVNPGAGTIGQGGASLGTNILEISSQVRATLSLRTNNTVGLSTMVMSANNGTSRDLHLNHNSDGDTYFTHYTPSGGQNQFWFKNNGSMGIGTNSPTAKLEVSAVDEGILIPRIALVGLNVSTPLTAPTVSELIYNTATAGTAPNNVIPGFYYWQGTQWVSMSDNSTWRDFVSSNPSNDVTDRIYHEGQVVIGFNRTDGFNGVVENDFDASSDAKLFVKGNIMLGDNPHLDPISAVGNGNFGIKFNSWRSYWNGDKVGAKIMTDFVPSPGCSDARVTDLVFLLDPGVFSCAQDVDDPTVEAMRIKHGGNVGIGTGVPTAKLSVNGTANKPGGGTWAVFSDARLKKDIVPYKEGLEFIKQVRPVSFSYNDELTRIWGVDEGVSNRVFQGVIAQDLQKIAPDMVRSVQLENKTDQIEEHFLEVDPNKFTYALINAVKEQQVTIEQQQAELDQLKIAVKKMSALLKHN